MAPRKKKEPEYIRQAKTTSIRATSRASIKVGDSFYTLEYCEERAIPQDVEINLNQERKMLWDRCNAEVDAQIEDVLKTFSKK